MTKTLVSAQRCKELNTVEYVKVDLSLHEQSFSIYSTFTLNTKPGHTVSHELLYLNSVLLSFSPHTFSSPVPLLSSLLSSSILSSCFLFHHLSFHILSAGLLSPLPCPLFSVLACPPVNGGGWQWLCIQNEKQADGLVGRDEHDQEHKHQRRHV